MKIIGIDLGLTGAIVVYDSEIKTVIDAIAMPTRSVQNKRVRDKKTKKMKWTYKKEYNASPISTFLTCRGPLRVAVLEPITAFPMKGPGGENRMSFGRLAEGFGGFKFILVAFAIPYLLAHPRTWKKHFKISADFLNFELMAKTKADERGFTKKQLKKLIDIEKKNASVTLVHEMIQKKKLTVVPDVKIDHNMADAILLAVYRSEIEDPSSGENDGKKK